MIKLILAVILVPTLVVGAVVLFTPWLDNLIVNNIPRPQDPVKRNYLIRDVQFEGGETGVTLAGELTMPESGGPFPAIVMITGSGPQDRNEQILGHRPFLVFSDYMTKRGYAVLRYDDRGFAESTGNHDTATTNDFANDGDTVQIQSSLIVHFTYDGKAGVITQKDRFSVRKSGNIFQVIDWKSNQDLSDLL